MKIKELYIVIVVVLWLTVWFGSLSYGYFGKYYPIYGVTSTLPPEGE